MKKITTKELFAFFQAMNINNISYRDIPRNDEEIENLVFVYNSSTKQYYSLDTNSQLSPDERIVTPIEIFSKISKNIDIITNPHDDYCM